jgi:hypothetical protein
MPREEVLPPQIVADVAAGSLLHYWQERVAQHIHDRYASIPLSKFPEDPRTYEHLLAERTRACARDRYAVQRKRPVVQRSVVAARTLRPGQPAARHQRRRRSGRGAAELDVVDPTGITLVEGDVHDPILVREVIDRIAGARCFAVKDSAQEYDTTPASLRGFGDLVAPGGFFVVEGGCVDIEHLRITPEWPPGVLPALEDWLTTQQGRVLSVRLDLELYGVSCHPNGFLQRSLPGHARADA